MRICLLIDDDDIARELTAAGGELVDAPEDADVLVVDRSHPRIPEVARSLGRRRRGPSSRMEALMSAAMEAAGDVIEISTPEAEYEYVNPAYERVLGWTLEEALGKTPGQLIRSDAHDDAYFKKIDETLKAGKSWTGLLISKARDGRLVYLEGTVAAMKDEHGNITHHMAVKRDITERIKAEAELRRKKEELEQARDAALEASRAKSQFLANMSHELRTPLNAIIGYSEMLLEDSEDEQTSADLRKIRKAGQHLLTLIDDVLDISKIEAGAMKLHIEVFDVATAVKSAVATVEPLMVERGNKLEVLFGDDLGEMRADLTKVRQALLNLLSNAAKFTDGGRVTLRVSKSMQGDEPFFEFEIRDTGIGIEPDHLKRLFRPFVQADASTSRRYGGTGLGLAISQRFCGMMGGQIEVQSEVGKGSVFTIKLPSVVDWPDPDPELPAPTRPLARRGQLVLVVDDDPTIRDLLTRKLGKHGFHVESAVDGAEGLARARELKPAAIVLDVMMPELDGWAVLSELKRDPETTDIPVVLLTILRQSEVGFALGAVDYLVKPVETERLVKVLHRHCRTSSARVLVVDDDEPSREFMRRALRAAGHNVSEAADGRAAIDAMELDPPDLLVLDLMMPVLDGFAVVQHMRDNPSLRTIPVVIVTAKTLTTEDRGMLRGARAIFERSSYDRSELLDAVAERVAELVQDG